MKVCSLGGSGEDGRSCFLVNDGERSFLLDCGVRRELSSVDRVYPLLTEEIAKSLDFVFLSHCHEDHSAALPYLVQLGFRGKVYCSPETMESTPAFMKKWTKYVISSGKELPFDINNIERLEFSPIPLGKVNIEGIEAETGRSGHVLGGLWIMFHLSDGTLLYTGDTTGESLLLERDPFPSADVLICDAAYGDRVISQDESYSSILDFAREVLGRGGRILFPVPSNGRGIDIALYLGSHGIPLSTDTAVIKSAQRLSGKKEWLKESSLWNSLDKLCDKGSGFDGALVLPDGMMTTEKIILLFESMKAEELNALAVTGHAAESTAACEVMKKEWREKNGVRLESRRITVKVHPDRNDVKAICLTVKPGRVILFHSRRENCTSLVRELVEKGFSVTCGLLE